MIDTSDLEATLEPDVVEALLAVYRTDLHTRLAALHAATTPEAIRAHAHGLRSGAATFHASALAAAARTVEQDPTAPLDAVTTAATTLADYLASR